MQPTELFVLSTTSPKEALLALAPSFERATGIKVRMLFVPGSQLLESIKNGPVGDVLVAPNEIASPLSKEGVLITDSWMDFARSSTSLAVRSGAPRPDIGSPEQFRDAVLSAKSVSFSRGASGSALLNALVRLGIAEQVKAKTIMPAPGELVGSVVARGDAEIGIQQLSELLPVPGIDIIGPLPLHLQIIIVYGAALLKSAKDHETSTAFVRYLRSVEAVPVLDKAGFKTAI